MRKPGKFFLCLAATAAITLFSNALFNSGVLDFSEPTVFETGSYGDYYYLELDTVQQQAYTAVRENIYTFPAQIEIPELESGALSSVLDALLCDDPQLFMFDSGSLMTVGKRHYFVPDYLMEITEYEKLRADIESAANKIISAMPDGTDYEKELYIHDTIINSCTYSDNDVYSESTAEGVLLEGKAKCSGYARTFKLLLEKAGIESVLISGMATDYDGNAVNHMWNAVKLDGSWYFTDITWDDPVSDDGTECCRHVFFNINEAMLRRTHSDYSFAYPCDSSALYYYEYNNAYYNVYNKETLLSIADLIAESENGEAEFMFASTAAFESAAQELFEGEDIYRALETANLKSNNRLVTTAVRYRFDYDSNLITVFFEQKD